LKQRLGPASTTVSTRSPTSGRYRPTAWCRSTWPVTGPRHAPARHPRPPGPPPVWELYRLAQELTGGVSTLLEWDADIPTYPNLVAELDKARSHRDCVAPPHLPRCSPDGGHTDRPSTAGDLKDHQKRMLDAFTGGTGAVDWGKPPRRPNRRCPPRRRSGIYAEAYLARLTQTLRLEFPALRGFLAIRSSTCSRRLRPRAPAAHTSPGRPRRRVRRLPASRVARSRRPDPAPRTPSRRPREPGAGRAETPAPGIETQQRTARSTCSTCCPGPPPAGSCSARRPLRLLHLEFDPRRRRRRRVAPCPEPHSPTTRGPLHYRVRTHGSSTGSTSSSRPARPQPSRRAVRLPLRTHCPRDCSSAPAAAGAGLVTVGGAAP